MRALDPPRAAMHRYALWGVGAVIVLNLLARTLLKLGGIPATLLVASSVAIGLVLVFRWRQRRLPERGERLRLLLIYGGLLGVLYLGLFALMLLKDEPGLPGQLLFFVHYLSYPLLLAVSLSPRWTGWLRQSA